MNFRIIVEILLGLIALALYFKGGLYSIGSIIIAIITICLLFFWEEKK